MDEPMNEQFNNQPLKDKRVAILATDGYEQSELLVPLERLCEAGAKVEVISPKSGRIQGFKHFDKAEQVNVDRELSQATADDYDALVIPGGTHNPDQLRVNPEALSFTRQFFERAKPVGAICHGPWVLVNAEVVAGRTLTSWPAIRRDIENAGGTWVDQAVVVDNGLVSSRKPADLDGFCDKLIAEISEGRHRQAGDLGQRESAAQ